MLELAFYSHAATNSDERTYSMGYIWSYRERKKENGCSESFRATWNIYVLNLTRALSIETATDLNIFEKNTTLNIRQKWLHSKLTNEHKINLINHCGYWIVYECILWSTISLFSASYCNFHGALEMNAITRR